MARFFTDSEVAGLSPVLVAILDRAREVAGVPFRITSGYRDPAHNTAVGGKDNSAHTKGLAVDLLAQDNTIRYRIVEGLLEAGFRRIGIYPFHIHADIDSSLPSPRLWLKDTA